GGPTRPAYDRPPTEVALTDRPVDRIARALGVPDVVEKLASLQPSDLQSLMLEVYARLSAGQTPARVLGQHRTNRLLQPAGKEPPPLHGARRPRLVAVAEGLRAARARSAGAPGRERRDGDSEPKQGRGHLAQHRGPF